ncbi:DUF58 domain-containing protein [bacterium]|nr:DUF58 domain-containing protein [bacterium]
MILRWVDEVSLIAIGLVFFLVASNTQTGWVYLMSGTIFGALITSWLFSRRALRPLGFRLWLPAHVPCGHGFWATLSWSQSALGFASFWSPCPGLGLTLNQQGRSQALLLPHQRELRVWLVAERRGRYARMDSELVCYGPLAWFAARRSLQPQLSQPLCVLPRRLELGSQKLRAWAGGQWSGRRGQPAGQGDLRRLRDYQVGDDVRWIHWASSARTGELVVREFSAGATLDVVLCWGCAPLSVTQPGSEAAFEWMLSWVYTFFVGAKELGWRVHLLHSQEDGSWLQTEQVDSLASASLKPDSPPPPWHPEKGLRRLDFWLGPAPGSQAECFEFHPADFTGPTQVCSGFRVGPGREPSP